MEENTDSLFTAIVIKEVKEETDGFKSFVLEPVGNRKITYQAGQYITLVHQGRVEEVRRSYSFTSAPLLDEPMTIGVKRIDNGAFSRLLFQLKAGDLLTSSGSGGFFILPGKKDAPLTLFFLAAGAGITPIFPMIKTALAIYPATYITLIYSNRSPETTIFLETLNRLSEKYKDRLNIEYLFSEKPNLALSHLNPGLLNSFLKKQVADISSALFYLCGPEAYMRMCLFTLKEAGVTEKNIRKETFITTKKKEVLEAPPDISKRQVSILFKEKKITIEVEYPNTILQSARLGGIELPYSCQTGKCGNCAARIITGKVWMSYNEVLSEKDILQGLTLTCTGYPVDGDVLLKI
ncbi:MAG: iron-sulfur cluster-binding domain-containing protein [Flavitalea sp.]